MTQISTGLPDQTADFAQLLDACDLVIFDFDGVIADSEVISLATLQTALRQFGIDLTTQETRDTFLGTSLATIKTHIKRHGTGDPDTLPLIWETELFARFKTDLSPVPQVFDLIDRFDATNQRYCIASSGTQNRIKTALTVMGRLDRFNHIFSAEQVARGKPAPDLFEFAASNIGVRPEACLVIEDSPHGIRAAKAAGMASVGFLGGKHLIDVQDAHRDLLLTRGATMVIPSFAASMKQNIAKRPTKYGQRQGED